MKPHKMASTAKVLEKVLKILQRVAIVCIVVAVVLLGILTVLTLMNAINPNAVIGTDFNVVVIGSLTFELAEEFTSNNSAVLVCAWSMATAAVIFIVLICYALGIIRKILMPMAEGNPFTPGVGREIRKLAFLSLAIGAAFNLFGVIEAIIAFHFFDMNSLIQNSQIQSVTTNFRFDVVFAIVIVFFVLLLLSYIFRYGEELQKLSDETL